MTRRFQTATFACVIALIFVVVVQWRAAMQVVAALQIEPSVPASQARLWVLRLRPGDDLVDSMMEFSRRHSIEAGAVVTCVGSLDRARLRYANQSDYEDLGAKGRHFEIVSFVGTLSTTSHHLHLTLANEVGDVFGGHAGSGNKVYTTAEIVIAEGLDWTFQRERDPKTTYVELSPVPRQRAAPDKAR